eukprot:GHVN01045097.1.p1 GENE.GHVN01045097.1~~GHVN01045097.1.p1  ORF type:complete len:288 (-),score=70.80 GHVN01045097.1:126-989(-)
MEPIGMNDVIRAATIGVVHESKSPDWPVGQWVMGFGGMCDYYVGIPGVTLLFPFTPTPELPATTNLSVCSFIIGLTAWHGVNKVLEVKGDGDIVCISGAAGAVGSLVGQLSKLKGAKVIGIAGGDEKCKMMKDELKFDCVIDYKKEDVSKAMKAFAPDGVSHYYDNVGGDVTDAVLLNAGLKCKMAMCGSISEYEDQWTGLKNVNMILMKRMTIHGFICTDHIDELQDARKELNSLVSSGKIKYKEDVRSGLEEFPTVVNLLFKGENKGKLILKVNEPPVSTCEGGL